MPTTNGQVPLDDLPLLHQDVVRKAIGIYVRWLNQYLDDDPTNPSEFRYSTDHFLDKSVNPHADLSVHVIRDDGPDYFNGFYAEITPYDGDDGGPATLFLYADNYGADPNNLDDEYDVRFILQEFDTMFSPVYSGEPEELFKN